MKDLHSLMGDELKALTFLSRPRLNRDEQCQVRALIKEVNFEYLLRQIDNHRIWPCVYCNVRDYFSTEFPSELTQYLKNRYEKNVSQSLRQFKAYGSIQALFSQYGIPAKPLKGMALANTFYGDFAKRHSHDIDVLIRLIDVDRAHKRLAEIGFCSPEFDSLTYFQRSRYFRANKDITYSNKDGVTLELHVRLCEFGGEMSIQGAKDLLDNKSKVSPEELVYLCWHASNTLFHRLKWIQDLALYFKYFEDSLEADSDSLLAIAERYNERRSLVVSWVVVHILYGNPLPKKIREIYLKDSIAKLVVRQSISNLNKPRYILSTKHKMEIWCLTVLSAGSWKMKYDKFVQKIRPNINVISRYPFIPGNLFFLFYFIRPIDLVYRHTFGKSH